MVLQAVLIEAGIASIGKLTEALSEAVDFVVESQKASNAMGLSLTESRRRLGDSLDGLRGTYESKIATGLELLDAGFQGNLEGLTDFVQTIRLQDGNTQAAIRVMSKVENVMNASREGQVMLLETLEETAYKYTVSADKLVKALDSLDMQTADLAGFGPEFAAARGILEGEFAGQSEEQLNSFFKLLTDRSSEAFTSRAQLGLQDVVFQLQQSTTAEGDAEIIKSAIIQAGQQAKTFLAEELGPFSLGKVDELFGNKAAVDAITLMENMGKEVRETNEDNVTEVGSDFGNVMAEIFNKPLQFVTEEILDVRVTNPTEPFVTEEILDVRVTNPTEPTEVNKYINTTNQNAQAAALGSNDTDRLVAGLTKVTVAVEGTTEAVFMNADRQLSLERQTFRT